MKYFIKNTTIGVDTEVSKTAYEAEVTAMRSEFAQKVINLNDDDFIIEYLKFFSLRQKEEEGNASMLCLFLCLEELFKSEVEKRKLQKRVPATQSSPQSGLSDRFFDQLKVIFGLTDAQLVDKYVIILQQKVDYEQQKKADFPAERLMSAENYRFLLLVEKVVKRELKDRGLDLDTAPKLLGADQIPFIKL